jgi:hypothetical protein
VVEIAGKIAEVIIMIAEVNPKSPPGFYLCNLTSYL